MNFITLFIAVLAVLATSNALTIDVLGDFNFENELTIVSGVFDGDVEFGSLLALSFVGTLNSSLEITGDLNIGSTLLAFASEPTLRLASGAVLTVSNINLKAGSIILESGASLIVTGQTLIESDTVFSVAAGASVSFSSDVSGEGSIDCSGALNFAANLAVAAEVVVNAAATATVQAGETVFNGAVALYGALVVEAEAAATFAAEVALDASANITIEAEAEGNFNADVSGEGQILVWGGTSFEAAAESAIEIAALVKASGENSWAYIEGAVTFASASIFTGVEVAGEAIVEFQSETEFNADITLGSGSSVEFSGSSVINADVHLEADANATAYLIYSSASETTSEIVAASVEAAVQVKGSASLLVTASAEAASDTVAFVGGLAVSGSGSFAVSSGSSCSVEGDASFSADASYTIEATSAASRFILDVQGQVDLDGTINVVTDVVIEGATEIVLMTYESRVEGSVFAEVHVTGSSGKRSTLQDSGYEVDYRDNEAVLVSSGEPDTDSSVALVGSVLTLIALLY